MLAFPAFCSPSAAEEIPKSAESSDGDYDARSDTNEAKEQFLTFQQRVNATNSYFYIDLGFLDLNEKSSDKIAPHGSHERLL